MDFADKLKKLRTERDVTHKQLSEETGISLSSISSYEQGRRKPKIEQIDILAEYFNVPASYFQNDNFDLDAQTKYTIQNVHDDFIKKFNVFCSNIDETLLERIQTTLMAFIAIYNSEHIKNSDVVRVFDALTILIGFTREYVDQNISAETLSKMYLDAFKDITNMNGTNSHAETVDKKELLLNNYDKLNKTGQDELVRYSRYLLENPIFKATAKDNKIVS